MNIYNTLATCIEALNSMTVSGRHNCTVIAGVCNDLERVMEVVKDDQDGGQGNISAEG